MGLWAKGLGKQVEKNTRQREEKEVLKVEASRRHKGQENRRSSEGHCYVLN